MNVVRRKFIAVPPSNCLYHLCLTGLHNLSLLNLEGCPVTAACLDSLAGLYTEVIRLFLAILIFFWSLYAVQSFSLDKVDKLQSIDCPHTSLY